MTMTLMTHGRSARAAAACLAVLMMALTGVAPGPRRGPARAAAAAPSAATVTLASTGHVAALAVDERAHRALALQTNGPATLIDTRAMAAVGGVAAPDDASAVVYDPVDDAFVTYETGYYPGTRLAAYRARDGRRLYDVQLRLSGAQYIQAVALDARARVLYVLVPGAAPPAMGQLLVIDAPSGRVRQTVTLPHVPLGLLAVDPASGRVYIPAAEDALIEYAGARVPRGGDRAGWIAGLTRVVPLAGTPAALIADGVTGRVFAADRTGDRIVMFDGARGLSQGAASVGAAPVALALDGPGHRLYVVAKTAAAVDVLDTRTGRQLRTLPVGAEPDAVAVDAPHRRVYVRNDEGIVVIDLATGRRLVVVPAPLSTNGPLVVDGREGVGLVGSGPLAGAATVTLIDSSRS